MAPLPAVGMKLCIAVSAASPHAKSHLPSRGPARAALSSTRSATRQQAWSAQRARPRRTHTCADVPARLPELRVVLRDAEADLLADLKAPGRAQEHELGRLVGVLRGQDDAAVVQPTRKWRLLGPAQHKVPVEEVVVCGVRIKLVRWLRALRTTGQASESAEDARPRTIPAAEAGAHGGAPVS